MMSRSLSNKGSARLIFGVEADPAGPVDLQIIDVGAVGFAAARGGDAALASAVTGVEAAPEDEVHHPLVGAIAIFERDLLGQDVDPLDRLGRDVAYLGEAGDAPAVEQDDRPSVLAVRGRFGSAERSRRAIR